jgi:hypothetical protein
MDSQNLELDFKVPIVLIDGQTISIHENGMVDIIFWQGRTQSQKKIKADVVAAVKYVSVEDLKRLRGIIDETIEKFEKREP